MPVSCRFLGTLFAGGAGNTQPQASTALLTYPVYYREETFLVSQLKTLCSYLFLPFLRVLRGFAWENTKLSS
jgi:hypothetical protein